MGYISSVDDKIYTFPDGKMTLIEASNFYHISPLLLAEKIAVFTNTKIDRSIDREEVGKVNKNKTRHEKNNATKCKGFVDYDRIIYLSSGAITVRQACINYSIKGIEIQRRLDNGIVGDDLVKSNSINQIMILLPEGEMTVKEASDMYGVCVQTIYKRFKEGAKGIDLVLKKSNITKLKRYPFSDGEMTLQEAHYKYGFDIKKMAIKFQRYGIENAIKNHLNFDL